MALTKLTGTTPTRRFATKLDTSFLSKKRPEKSLTRILPKKSGRNASGKVVVEEQGGRQKRFYRKIDFKRDKKGIKATVISLEYDPNRNCPIAILNYADGEKRYILAPIGLKIGDMVLSGGEAEIKPGNALPLENMAVGTVVHNIELVPGFGGKLARSAGSQAVVLAKEENYVHLKMPSGEIRKIFKKCYATVGQVGNEEVKSLHLGKAGRKRHLGIRPHVRGTAKNPRSHPHGGGEGRSGEGMNPKTPWGKPARGKKTRRPKPFDKFIIQRRK